MFRNRKLHGCLLSCLLSVLVAQPMQVGSKTLDTQAKSVSALSNGLQNSEYVEAMLVRTLQLVEIGDLQQAMDSVNELLRVHPNFSLGYLIRGDLLAAKANMIKGFGNDNDSNKVRDLRAEAETRIKSYFEKDKTKVMPNLMVSLNSNQQHLLVVDTTKSRMFVYKKQVDGQLKYWADFYVTIGRNGVGKQDQGDKRTPVGVYFASSKLNKALPDLYGDAAYPLSYPNELDQRQRKTGSGIWIHGTPHDTYSRPPQASDGCVVLSNPDLGTLAPILQQGDTPVIIGVNLGWVSPQELKKQQEIKAALASKVERWRQDWEKQDTNAYLSHYSQRFFYSDGTLSKWADYKRKIQSAKPKVRVALNGVSMFAYPNTNVPMVVVNFEQDFTSDALHNTMKKRQYWVYEDGQWKILYEGAA